ncbi:MAG TPA: BrnT family toxin [Pyrinomonadaceae bacterium]|nr:BrnT family toxin [Pyrinomonadaceae bacterium]
MFAWDEEKRKKVVADHNVDFALIADIFDDPFALYADDLGHSENELRYTVIGKTARYGLTFLVFSYVDDQICFITARRAENWMLKAYER